MNPIQTDQIQKIIQALNVGAVGGSSKGTYTGFAPNKDIPEKDRYRLSIVLKNNNMKFSVILKIFQHWKHI